MNTNPHAVAAALQQVLLEQVDEAFDIFAEHGLQPTNVQTYAERGVLTRDAGFVLTLAGGAEFQVTVVRSR